jgi:hypothetical protein
MTLDTREWRRTGLGGYAMGTVCGVRTRRYHALPVAAARPPASRMLLGNGLQVFAETPGGVRRDCPQSGWRTPPR